MIDPTSKKDMSMLSNAVRWSYHRLQPFREKALDVIRQYVGYNYSDDGTDDRVPVNMMELACNTYSTQLSANTPRVLVRTPHSSLKVSASDLELALNHLLEEIDLGSSLRAAVQNALMAPVGVLKVGLGSQGEIEIDGVMHDISQPFVDVVEFDDFVCDMSARTWEACQFIGNRYTLPYEDVKDNKFYDGPGQEHLQVATNSLYTGDGDEKFNVLSLSEEAEFGDGSYKKMVQLLDLWLPAEGAVLTVPWDFGESPEPKDYLRMVEWEGPERGMYHMLSFNDVPGNLIPLSPAATWMDLHDIVNRVFRKVARQAERQKTVVGYQGEAQDDAERIKNADDGDMIMMNNPSGTQEYRFGGADQTGLAFEIHAKDLFSYMAGNLDMLGGLGPQSDTLGQDRMLAQSASKRLGSMSAKTVKMAQGVVESLADWLWNDPMIQLPMTKRVPGLENIEIEDEYTPEKREGDFLDYNFRIEPYSMQHKSPGDRLEALNRLFANYLSNPMVLQAMQEQGISIDAEGLLRLVAKYEDMTELEEIMTMMNSASEESGGPVESLRPGVTHNINERVNRPGATRSGKDQILIQSLMGSAQPSEAASLTRSTG